MKQNKLKALGVFEISDVAGGGTCACVRQPTNKELQDYSYGKNGGSDALNNKCILWTKNFDTKSKCQQACCEVAGGDFFCYGGSQTRNQC